MDASKQRTSKRLRMPSERARSAKETTDILAQTANKRAKAGGSSSRQQSKPAASSNSKKAAKRNTAPLAKSTDQSTTSTSSEEIQFNVAVAAKKTEHKEVSQDRQESVKKHTEVQEDDEEESSEEDQKPAAKPSANRSFSHADNLEQASVGYTVSDPLERIIDEADGDESKLVKLLIAKEIVVHFRLFPMMKSQQTKNPRFSVQQIVTDNNLGWENWYGGVTLPDLIKTSSQFDVIAGYLHEFLAVEDLEVDLSWCNDKSKGESYGFFARRRKLLDPAPKNHESANTRSNANPPLREIRSTKDFLLCLSETAHWYASHPVPRDDSRGDDFYIPQNYDWNNLDEDWNVHLVLDLAVLVTKNPTKKRKIASGDAALKPILIELSTCVSLWHLKNHTTKYFPDNDTHSVTIDIPPREDGSRRSVSEIRDFLVAASKAVGVKQYFSDDSGRSLIGEHSQHL